MPIKLYYFHSPPSLSVRLLLKQLGIVAEEKLVNLREKEQHSPEYLAMNPEHTTPTIVDDGFVLWESRAILQYLASKNKSELYPTELKKRAQVDRLLYFDATKLYKRVLDYVRPTFTGQAPSDEKNEEVKEALTFLNTFIGQNQYVAGQSLTIADLSLVVTVSVLKVVNYNLSDWPAVASWQDRLTKQLTAFEEIVGGSFKELSKLRQQQEKKE